MTDLPTTLTGLDAGWLNQKLVDAGAELPELASVTVDPMDGFTGAMGEVGIVHVEWADPQPHLPASFVAKCPLDDDIARMYNGVMQFYVRESGFYRDLAHRVDMRIPKCWLNLFDEESGNALLMLEHITDADKGDILDGCSADAMRTLVGDLARMHGAFWMAPELREIPWLFSWDEPTLELGIEITQQSWYALREAEPERYPAELAELLERTWINDTRTWLARYAERPWTLTHIDYELDNVLLSADGPVIVDWQSVMRSHPGVDLAWLLAASHNDETLAAEPELLDHYRATLAASGGPDWSSDELEAELAFGLMYPVSCQPVPYLQDTSAYGEEGSGRMHDRFEKFLQGSIDAAMRWNLIHHISAIA